VDWQLASARSSSFRINAKDAPHGRILIGIVRRNNLLRSFRLIRPLPIYQYFYGLERPTADVDVVELAPRAAAETMMELGMSGVPQKCILFKF
jgi:hypothetical protein